MSKPPKLFSKQYRPEYRSHQAVLTMLLGNREPGQSSVNNSVPIV